jgi:uncharacterized membrane protein YidH (DUF202 family)
MNLMLKWKQPRNALDVDIRFLLAFISTDSKYGTLAGLGAITFGGLLALIGYVRYRVADAAIRAGKLPATGFGGMFVVAGVVIFAAILVIAKEFAKL